MIPKKLELSPAWFPRALELVEELCDDESPSGASVRVDLAWTLEHAPADPVLHPLARVVARALIRDGAENSRIEALVKKSGDWALRTDLPKIDREKRTVEVRLRAQDTGAHRLRAAARTRGGRLLFALGEAGVRLTTADGRPVAHFDVPAERLVISDSGGAALALARRGPVWRISRLDLCERRVAGETELALDDFAESYDGGLWFVARGGSVYALDVLGRFEALWQVDRVGGRVTALTRFERELSFIVAETAAVWSYELPGLVLRIRRTLEVPRETVAMCLAPGGRISRLLRESADRCRLESEGLWYAKPVSIATGESPVNATLLGGAAHLTLGLHGKEGLEVRTWDGQGMRASLFVEAPLEPFVDLYEEQLAVGDARGRVAILDLQAGRLMAKMCV